MTKRTEIKRLWKILEVVGLFGTIFSIWLAFYLSSPIDLQVWHNISESDGRLKIYAKNNDLFRSTGVINLYRVEISDSKPHIQLFGNDTLKWREEKLLFNLLIRTDNKNINLFDAPDCYKKRKCIRIQTGELYFLTEKTSITYKITCDACPQQGIIRRIPKTGDVPFDFTIENNEEGLIFSNITIPIYNWPESNLTV